MAPRPICPHSSTSFRQNQRRTFGESFGRGFAIKARSTRQALQPSLHLHLPQSSVTSRNVSRFWYSQRAFSPPTTFVAALGTSFFVRLSGSCHASKHCATRVSLK